MEDALSDIIRQHHELLMDLRSNGNEVVARENLVCNGLDDIASHLRQVNAFLIELKTKLENILALVTKQIPMQSLLRL